MIALATLVEALRANRGLAHKADIADVVHTLGVGNGHTQVPVGDDCAAIPDGNGGYQLLAIEGFINEFVAHDPWFAGWCGVMVNVSDIYAMGGRPTAVVDAAWSRGRDKMRELLEGLAAASRAYGVPVVGGHSNARCDREQLSVAILGHARKLLTSFDARPGDALIAAIDLRGAYRAPYPHWNASTTAPPERLRADLDLLPQLAEAGLCAAAKDISQAGLIGTSMMLLECSGVGATIDVERVPRPADVDLSHWLLSTFPSFGFVLAVPQRHVAEVLARFRERELGCAVIGKCNDGHRLQLRNEHGDQQLAWDFRERSLIGCGPPLKEKPDA
ncbi:MAG: synthase-like protein sll0787 family [Hydrocarboniphaga sp.]|uniref:sll0787 family AIR synthase-like protein n=1 Tax=Hydrocarboniphaga sp. TaxID=2033016 RepID=UPI0026031B96|nr:sll0787 family AIR synthase-like protein [Hydrocarboniphaga sp.]MDB5967964.1 synthase-like protein sll0787 family [Hydrocarboniphaga sp.]